MKRVDCSECSHFVEPVFNLDEDWDFNVIEKAKCKLGKRVMFRIPMHNHADGAYPRYCNEFKNKVI